MKLWNDIIDWQAKRFNSILFYNISRYQVITNTNFSTKGTEKEIHLPLISKSITDLQLSKQEISTKEFQDLFTHWE